MRRNDRRTAAGALMRAYIDAARSGDWEAAYGFFAEDIRFRIPGRSHLAGERRGRRAAIDYIETARRIAHAGEVILELVDMLESRDRVALIVRERFDLGDREVEIRRANVYRIEDEKIVEVWIFEADQYGADALFGVTSAAADDVNRAAPQARAVHIHLDVHDIPRAIAFYTLALGLDLHGSCADGTALIALGDADRQLELHPAEARLSARDLDLRYPTRRALADALRRLRRHEVQLDAASDHGVCETLYLTDPDGHRIALSWERPQAEWPVGADGRHVRLDLPLDVDALLDEAA